MANGWFRKRAEGEEGEAIPEGLWTKCEKCSKLLFTREWERNLKVCEKCGYHFRLTARERLDVILDPDSFVERDGNLVSLNPLGFPGYDEKLQRNRAKTGMADAILSGEGTVGGRFLTVAVTDFHFAAGSMGSVVGERVARTVERATELQAPVLLVSGTGGGARQEEGLLSLMQMAKTSAAIARQHEAGLLTLVLLTHPSLAGVMASWGSLGDIILAEPGAMIGFAGQRVAQQAQVGKAPADFQTAEFHLAHGQIDRIVARKDLRDTIALLLQFAGRDASPALDG